MKHIRLSFSKSLVSIMLLGLLTSCGSVQIDAPEFELQLEQGFEELVGLQGKPILQSNRNCSVNEFDLPGQGYRAFGATGGLSNSRLFRGAPITIGNVSNVADSIQSLLAKDGHPKHDVLLLVPDDYNGGSSTELGENIDLLDNSFARSRLRLERLMNFLIRRDDLSHGAMVLNHIYGLLLNSNYEDVSDLNILAEGKVFKSLNADFSQFIYVVPVKTGGLDTAAIADNLDDSLKKFPQAFQINQVVVNMSFSIIPCDVVNDFEANRTRYRTFEQYARRVARVNRDLRGEGELYRDFLARVVEALLSPVDPNRDPLRGVIGGSKEFVDIANGGHVIYVAAAGNYGLDFATFPAAWPDVISVSSHDFNRLENKSIFSNSAEIMKEGAWFSLFDVERNRSLPNIYYAGNSYSSPEVALFSVFDLSHASPICGYQPASDNLPKLTYGRFDDLLLLDAVGKYCVP